MNRIPALLLALALLGAVPPEAGVIAGTVRDRHGAPIAGAAVGVYAGARLLTTVTTAADGTFAATGSGVDAVDIACKFCEPARVSVGADGIVVAIVARYDAVRSDIPTADDLAHLPYGDVESAISLAPFVLLSQFSRSVYDPQLDDRRISGHGGLLILNGTPNYDIESNASPYVTLPDYDASSIDVRRSSDAYLYGDTADAGTFIVGTTGGSQLAAAGSGVALRGAIATNGAFGSAAISRTDEDNARARVDAGWDFSAPGLAVSTAIGTGRSDENLPGDYSLASAFSSARISAERTSGADISASLNIDRGTYLYTALPYPADVAWSDVDARASIRARSTLSPFALLSFRRSMGETRLGQTRAVVGATLELPQFSAIAAVGSDAVSYDAYDATTTSPAHTHDGIVSATWNPAGAMSLEASARTGYWLPVFAVAYDQSPGAPIAIDQSNALESTFSVTDSKRLRLSLTALRYADQVGARSGSVGASVGWQVSPKISVRTWLLRDAQDGSNAASFGSTWATYQNGSFRMDWIVRRDLRNGLPDAHIDGSIGAAINKYAQWFAATERRNGIRTLRFGLRF